MAAVFEVEQGGQIARLAGNDPSPHVTALDAAEYLIHGER
jgi:hypothetical protein